jgi:hypothetical protein
MLYAIAGGGSGPTAEITKSLQDLRAKAEKDQVDFWLLIEGKDEPTDTDSAILKWVAKNEVWFEVITTTGTTYDGAQDTIQSVDVYATMLERITGLDGEDGSVLVLLPADTEDDDEPLLAFIEATIDAGVDCLQLNGAMAKLSLGEAEDVPEPEPEPAPAPVKKATKKAATATKKAATKAAAPTKKAAAAPVPQDDEALPEEAPIYTEAELTKMGVPELTGIARGQGIPTQGLGKRDLITAIIGKTKVESEEVAAAVVMNTLQTNGDTPMLVIIVPLAKVQSLLE